MSQIVDEATNGKLAGSGPEGPSERGAGGGTARPAGRRHEPVGYLTAHDLAALWDERAEQVELHRREYPSDLPGIEQRQRQAIQALQAYRVLCELEEQLGFELALPVLGPRRPRPLARANRAVELID